MKNYFFKLRHIVPQVLAVVIGTTLTAIAFRWISLNFISLPEEVFSIWMPLLLPLIPIWFWVNPKLKILKFENPNRGTTYFQFIAWAMTASLIYFSQEYVKKTSGQFSSLESIDSFVSESKFVRLAKMELDTTLFGKHTDPIIRGRYDELVELRTYLVYPIKTIDQRKNYWFGLRYETEISNKLSEPEQLEQHLIAEQRAIFEFKPIANNWADYYEVTLPSADLDGFLSAVRSVQTNQQSNLVILQPQGGAYENGTSHYPILIGGAFLIGLMLFSLALLIPGIHSESGET